VLCLLLCGGCVCYCHFVWFFKFNEVVLDEVRASPALLCANLRLMH